MSTTLATKRLPEASSGIKAAVVVVFYLLTFVTGGFFLFGGSRLGFVADLTAAGFYIVATVFFYALSRGAQEEGS